MSLTCNLCKDYNLRTKNRKKIINSQVNFFFIFGFILFYYNVVVIIIIIIIIVIKSVCVCCNCNWCVKIITLLYRLFKKKINIKIIIFNYYYYY